MQRSIVLRLAVLAIMAACGREPRDPSAGSGSSSPPPPAPAPASDPAARCNDFVAFAWHCGIGRPASDPTIDVGTQANNDLIIMMAVVEHCRAHRPPYDADLIACFASAAGDCERYKACADAVVTARSRP